MIKLFTTTTHTKTTTPVYPAGTVAQDCETGLYYQYRHLDDGWYGWVRAHPMTYVEAQPDPTPLQECPMCGGKGSPCGCHTCWECQGTGTVPAPLEVRMSPCPLCEGKGKVPEEITDRRRLASLIERLARRIE